MSNAAKVDAYDAVSAERDLMHLVLYDQMKGLVPRRLRHEEPCDNDEVYIVVADLYRPTGGHGGIVVLKEWTQNAEGEDVGHAVEVTTIDALNLMKLPDYYRSVPGRARAAMTHKLIDARRVAGQKEIAR
jgi:hypothetical protein